MSETATAPDWRTMEAGRELDAIVAEQLLGWVRVQTLDATLWRAPGDGPARYGGQRSLPACSTDNAVAVTVLEKLRTDGRGVTVIEDRKGWEVSVWQGPHYSREAGDLIGRSVGAFALAVCRAALEATEPGGA